MKILKKFFFFFFFFFFFEIGNFFFKLGKKSPKSHWERGRISAPEDTKKIPAYNTDVSNNGYGNNHILKHKKLPILTYAVLCCIRKKSYLFH